MPSGPFHLPSPTIYPLGDAALVVEFGTAIHQAIHAKVMALAAYLDTYPLYGMIEYVPAFTSITIYYDLWLVSEGGKHLAFDVMATQARGILPGLEISAPTTPRQIDIPVCYGGDTGPDLPFVASHTGLSEEQVIATHAGALYRVYMIGFAPGFPYLGGMDPSIAAPRKDSPQERIPAGSVGIAGTQTGIYPIETPGGWQIIGRTPLLLFDLARANPGLLQAGDTVRFLPITSHEYILRKRAASGN
jgi:inhibitor of KinA